MGHDYVVVDLELIVIVVSSFGSKVGPGELAVQDDPDEAVVAHAQIPESFLKRETCAVVEADAESASNHDGIATVIDMDEGFLVVVIVVLSNLELD